MPIYVTFALLSFSIDDHKETKAAEHSSSLGD